MALEGAPILRIDITKAVGQSFVRAFWTTLRHNMRRKEHTARTSTIEVRSFSHGPSESHSVQQQRVGKASFFYAWTCKVFFDVVGKMAPHGASKILPVH